MKKEKHILIVDDVATNLIFASAVLKKKFRVTTERSGQAALESMRKEKPDLLLLDIMMPGMNGYETYRKMKQMAELADIPVIFLTGDTENADEAHGINMGAMDFVIKPFVPEVLISRIERVLEVDSVKRGLEKQVELKSVEAHKDSLTGLWNRKYTKENVDFYLENEGARGALFILDMDNFKEVNDTYGHIRGDAVLIEFAGILKGCTRDEDIVCRIGGDEFIIFFKGNFDEEKAAAKSDEIISKVEQNIGQMVWEGKNKIKISVSIGITFAPRDGNDFMTLYNNADKSMYFVKQNGKCGYYFYWHEDTRRAGGDSSRIDLKKLQKYVKEYSREGGAYRVEYEGFKRIYQFVARCIARTNQKVQTLLFTMEDDGEISIEDILREMEELEVSIKDSLRRGDVCSHFSSNQFIVLLMDTDMQNGRLVAQRILESFRQNGPHEHVTVEYDIDEIETA